MRSTQKKTLLSQTQKGKNSLEAPILYLEVFSRRFDIIYLDLPVARLQPLVEVDVAARLEEELVEAPVLEVVPGHDRAARGAQVVGVVEGAVAVQVQDRLEGPEKDKYMG